MSKRKQYGGILAVLFVIAVAIGAVGAARENGIIMVVSVAPNTAWKFTGKSEKKVPAAMNEFSPRARSRRKAVLRILRRFGRCSGNSGSFSCCQHGCPLGKLQLYACLAYCCGICEETFSGIS